jgi:hypothetical protein
MSGMTSLKSDTKKSNKIFTNEINQHFVDGRDAQMDDP